MPKKYFTTVVKIISMKDLTTMAITIITGYMKGIFPR